MAGYIVIAVLSVILLLLLLPIKLWFGYEKEGGVSVKIHYAFIKKTLLPQEEKTKKIKKSKKQKTKKQSEKTDKKDEKSKTDKFSDYIGLISPILSGISKPLRLLCKTIAIKIDSFTFWICGKDSADTALLYGKLSGVIWSFYAVLCEVFTVKAKHVDISPYFLGEDSEIKADVSIKIVPLMALFPAIWMLINILIAILKYKGEDNNGREQKPDKRNANCGNEQSENLSGC